jgi:uncharacterized protein (TIGR02145 family)
MKSNLTKFATTAALVLATAYTFNACSSGGDGGGNDLSSASNGWGTSSSSGGNNGGTSSPGNGGGVTNKCTDAANCKKKQIGNKVWLAENLNIDVDGDSRCYQDKPENCDKYGRLYGWWTAMALPSKCKSTFDPSDADCTIKTPHHKGICPSGWHIPSKADWEELTSYVESENGCSKCAGRLLKATSGWDKDYLYGGGKSGNGEDKYVFSALPGGVGYDNNFSNEGRYGYWWSSTEYSSIYAYSRHMDYDSEDVHWSSFVEYSNDGRKGSNLYSVRCVAD